ncbi:MAG: nucleoside permease [Planctomycetaceae bacterium]|jgi:nucleoside transporter|nr:nucleoside permease [Planctomycetaceae bacterium]
MLTVRLFTMMFIQFFIWGAWYVTAPRALTPLGFTGADFGWTYSVGPIAGLISPFFVGMIADRFFATERVLALMHILGGAAMFAALNLMGGESPSPDAINFMFFLHMFCYYPTLALTNSLAMHSVTDSEKQFPIIRVGGTIGWIVAGLVLSWQGWGSDTMMFQLAAYASVGLGLYSLTLPHTPPPAKGQKFEARDALGLDAFVLLKNPSYLVFIVCSFLICIPLAFYYQMAERTLVAGEVTDTAFKMTFGQMSEILFMLLMPFFFKRLGVKMMLFVAMATWVARYVLFAIGTPDHVTWMLLLGVTVHGICYDFFFVTGQIYTDQVAPKAIRSQAQGLLVLFTLGLGMMIGAQVAGRVEAHYTPPETAELNDKATALLDTITDGMTDEDKKPIQDEAAALQLSALQAIDWKGIWTIPAGAAAVVMVIFFVLFKDSRPQSGAETESPADSDSNAAAETGER